MKIFVILGAAGNCKDILDVATALNERAGREEYRCAGFLDDSPALSGKTVNGARVLGGIGKLRELGDMLVVNGIGSAKDFWRKPEIIRKTGLPSERFLSLVHPTASVSGTAYIGRGAVLLQMVVVAANARIEDHVMVLPQSIISHDAVIGAYSIVAGGVCVNGGCEVERCCYLGSGTQIRERVRVREYTLCGMGSNVLVDVGPKAVVTGNPARTVRELPLA